ncbi:hypothetical protein G6F46_005190 [Rhizopus delemar]|uniref:histone deacetylase n=2 Tax=Rhizopus TaxID=4842 RepID=A0A9P6Z3P0_9FUNG|nr:hypothetical protein G6F55_004517 [Rhizopus delemar]KAG1544385.1 hypothetical protein G6F51_006092 [Rhizopus arrhizus]KAG1497738.1 hypothetical protein G6F54_005561 [Rhizopus delemar]KAG1513005.1 hypothetical protein G6F53_004758 [Rhizopus delemar]KAG1526675.1 hypothetical protein G6F52_002218 [Rhizopus delemar]
MSLKFVAKRATDQPVYLASKKAKNKENELEDEEKIEKVSQAKKKSEQRKKIEETERTVVIVSDVEDETTASEDEISNKTKLDELEIPGHATQPEKEKEKRKEIVYITIDDDSTDDDMSDATTDPSSDHLHTVEDKLDDFNEVDEIQYSDDEENDKKLKDIPKEQLDEFKKSSSENSVTGKGDAAKPIADSLKNEIGKGKKHNSLYKEVATKQIKENLKNKTNKDKEGVIKSTEHDSKDVSSKKKANDDGNMEIKENQEATRRLKNMAKTEYTDELNSTRVNALKRRKGSESDSEYMPKRKAKPSSAVPRPSSLPPKQLPPSSPVVRPTRSQKPTKKTANNAPAKGVSSYENISKRRLLMTGFVYDTIMSYHATPDPIEIHPEDPRRIYKIFSILEKHGLLAECVRIKSRRATREEITAIHSIIHYRKMRETTKFNKRSQYIDLEHIYDSIYLNSSSFESGLYAAGSLIALLEALVKDEIRNAFAIIRPPGHHAEHDAPMGFCLFNNVAIATHYCMNKLSVKKTLIVDWDVHFGNGTQNIFSDNPNVLYISLHRYEDRTFYPADRKGSAEYTGHGKGRGTTVNIPWPCNGMTDADYMYAFREVVIPISMEFNPDLLIVSAGFDAAIDDPIGQCKVTPAGYAHMTHMLKSINNGKMAIALEGGYNLNSTALSALGCLNVLLGDSPPAIENGLVPKQEYNIYPYL